MSTAGVLRLALDAGAALATVVTALPVAFALCAGDAAVGASRGETSRTTGESDEEFHDLGTIVITR